MAVVDPTFIYGVTAGVVLLIILIVTLVNKLGMLLLLWQLEHRGIFCNLRLSYRIELERFTKESA